MYRTKELCHSAKDNDAADGNFIIAPLATIF